MTSATTPDRTRWRAVVALGLTAFVIVSAEFLPVGVLPRVARDVGVPLGSASAVVLVPGLVAAITAPLIVTVIGRADRRLVVLLCTIVVAVADLGTWLVSGWIPLLACRALVGVALGGFWSVGPSLGARLAAPASRGVATSVVLAGISAGTVLALPIGQSAGATIGWRVAFGAALAATAIVVLLQTLWIPRLPPTGRVTVAELLGVVRAARSRIVLVLTVIGFSAQLMAATFIGAYLADVPSGLDAFPAAVLLIYGLAGLVGNFVAPRVRWSFPSLFVVIALPLAVLLGVLPEVRGLPLIAAALIVVWGLLWGAMPVVLQTWTMSTVPDRPEAGSTVLVSFLQASIALGSFLGGVAVTFGGVPTAFFAAGIGLIAATVVAARVLPRRPLPVESAQPTA